LPRFFFCNLNREKIKMTKSGYTVYQTTPLLLSQVSGTLLDKGRNDVPMFREKRMRHSSIRLAASVAVLLVGAAVSSRADVFVNGTFTGTFYANSGGTPIDTLGIFSSPGTDLTGQTITGSFTYDASTLPSIGSGPGYTDYQTPNNGSVTQTVNGVTVNLGTSVYMSLVLEEPPASGANIFDLETANYVPANPGPGQNFVYQYVRVEAVGLPFLNGLGNVQQFSVTAPDEVGGVDLFESYTYNAATGSYNPYVVEELPFTSNLNVTATTPEPAMLPALCACFAGLGIISVRRRKRHRA
jgi:hypothetical protein